jgi:hypothetical protein
MPDAPGELEPEGSASYDPGTPGALAPSAGSATPGTPGGLTPEGGGAASPGDPGNLTPNTPPSPVAPQGIQPSTPGTPVDPPPNIQPETPPSVPVGAQWATQDQAEAGISSNTLMSPLRTKQAIDEFADAKGTAAGLDASNVKLTGNQTISDTKTFASAPKRTATTTYADSTEILNQAQVESLLNRPRLVMFQDSFFTDKQWFQQNTGTGSQDFSFQAAMGYSGFSLNTGSTSGSIAGLASGVNGNLSPLLYKPWEQRFKVRTGAAITSCKYRIGFSGNGNNFNQDLWAVGGMGFDYNPALSPNWRFANDPGGGSPTYTDLGIAVATATIYEFLIRSNGIDNQCLVSINGGSETLITGARDYLVGPAIAIQNTSAAARFLIPIFHGFQGHS